MARGVWLCVLLSRPRKPPMLDGRDIVRFAFRASHAKKNVDCALNQIDRLQSFALLTMDGMKKRKGRRFRGAHTSALFALCFPLCLSASLSLCLSLSLSLSARCCALVTRDICARFCLRPNRGGRRTLVCQHEAGTVAVLPPRKGRSLGTVSNRAAWPRRVRGRRRVGGAFGGAGVGGGAPWPCWMTWMTFFHARSPTLPSALPSRAFSPPPPRPARPRLLLAPAHVVTFRRVEHGGPRVQPRRMRAAGQAAVPDVRQAAAAPGAPTELLLLAGVLQARVERPQSPPQLSARYADGRADGGHGSLTMTLAFGTAVAVARDAAFFFFYVGIRREPAVRALAAVQVLGPAATVATNAASAGAGPHPEAGLLRER